MEGMTYQSVTITDDFSGAIGPNIYGPGGTANGASVRKLCSLRTSLEFGVE